MRKQIIDINQEISKASEKEELYYAKMGPTNGTCDHCGKEGWSYLIGCGRPEDMEGHLQNADPCYVVGSKCFYTIMKVNNAIFKKFDWEKFGDSGTYWEEEGVLK